MTDDVSLCSLLYISQSMIVPQEAQAVVDLMVKAAIVRNDEMNLTGALLFTSTHFAQVLEGPSHNIDLMLADLRQDWRHDHMQIIAHNHVPRRRFFGWSMAYHGPSHFVSQHVTALLNKPLQANQRRAANRLTDLMYEFSKD